MYDKGISLKLSQQFQLGFDNNKDSLLYGRLIFPVRHPWSDFLVTISGRTLIGGSPKYRHLSFLGNRCLYGIPRQEKLERVAIVEGQLDAISLESLGIPTYAVLGSSPLTGWQVGLLKRWTNNIVIYGDNDTAGKNAAANWKQRLDKEGFKSIIGPYPPSIYAKDPNDLVRDNPEYIRKVLQCG